MFLVVSSRHLLVTDDRGQVTCLVTCHVTCWVTCHMLGHRFSHGHVFVLCEVQVMCSLVIMHRGEHSSSQYPLFRVITLLMTNQGYSSFEGEMPWVVNALLDRIWAVFCGYDVTVFLEVTSCRACCCKTGQGWLVTSVVWVGYWVCLSWQGARYCVQVAWQFKESYQGARFRRTGQGFQDGDQGRGVFR